jgi:hypothetical protein
MAASITTGIRYVKAASREHFVIFLAWREHGNPRGARDRFLQELPALGSKAGLRYHDPGDVSARAGEARHESFPDHIAAKHDDRDRLRRVFGRPDGSLLMATMASI